MSTQMSQEQWFDLCARITPAMQAHVMQFVTSISHVVTNDEGEAQGSGSYIEYEGKRLVITNEHVTRVSGAQFTHQFQGREEVFRLASPLAAEPHPVDVSLCPVADDVWSHVPHQSQVIPYARIAAQHAPAEREMLFFIGYSGERSKFVFGTLVSRGTPLLTQEIIPQPDGLHPNYFALLYNSEKAKTFDGSSGVLPTPPGLSGSLVWNSRFVECLQAGKPWSPDLAQVTGIVCRWSSADAYVVATRIEIVRDFLKRHLGGSG